MAKGYLITPEVEALITSVYRQHSKWKPREIRMVVRNLLREKSKEDPELLLKLNTGWPSLSSVRNKLPKRGKGMPNPKDEPWSIATLSEANYSIPPEAMPVVMAFYKKRLGKNDVLTIREALWAARLFKIVDPPDMVFDWAFLYATHELVAEEYGKPGEPFESKDLDLELINTPQYARETMREIDIWIIASKYKADPMQLKELNLSLEETEEIAKSGKYKWDGWDKPEVQNERKHKAKRQT